MLESSLNDAGPICRVLLNNEPVGTGKPIAPLRKRTYCITDIRGMRYWTDPHVEDGDGETPLFLACSEGDNKALVLALLEKCDEAKIQTCTKSGMNCLHAATIRGE